MFPNQYKRLKHGRHRKKLSPSLGHLASRSLPEDEIPEGIDRETNPDGDGGDEVFAPDVKNGHAIRNEKSNGVKEKEDGNLVSNDEDAMTMAKKVPLSGPLYHGNMSLNMLQPATKSISAKWHSHLLLPDFGTLSHWT
ncbi:hypothetical protein BSL78_01030 [Apostichopus japonicus]|uniref:Uncharacterized protein n=1 Tax=Stichopus japonicus TaxID=307972 RepID=A0A2G8LP21_STIJA|nr:hypothetical protein BSL78_01030 [Apostichopus japonicus]